MQLVLINISDHHTRTVANAGGPPPAGADAGGASTSAGGGAATRVLGCLLGSQSGRTVDISNSFEMRLVGGSDVDIDEAFLQTKMEQCEWPVPLACDAAAPSPPVAFAQLCRNKAAFSAGRWHNF